MTGEHRTAGRSASASPQTPRAPRTTRGGRVASGAYLQAACELTVEEEHFDSYELARRVERNTGRDDVSYRSAGRWIRRQTRGSGCLRRVLAARPGPIKHGGSPAAYAVAAVVLLREGFDPADRPSDAADARR
jgi:hypothetical protein